MSSSESEALVCRVCQATNVHLHHLLNSAVQVVFERLTSKKVIEDGRPKSVCYLCYSLLRKCCRFLEVYQRTEDIFSQLYTSGLEVNQDVLLLLNQSNIVNLSRTPIHHVDVLPTIMGTHSDKQKEPGFHPVAAIEEQVEIKIEPIECEYDYDGLNEDNVNLNDNEQLITTLKAKKLKKAEADNAIQNVHICQICDKKFKSKRILKMHMVTHTNKKLHICNECNTTFTFKHNLQRHVAVSHSSDVDNMRNHSCDVCHKKFTRKHHLSQHMRSHTRIKPYRCPICKKHFTSSSNVNTHVMEIHNNEKPYECEYCNKKFPRKGNLQEHLRTHTGERPYFCDKCEFTCSHLCNLKSHVAKSHS